MVTDGQVSELRRWLAAGKSLAASARMASMDKKTARSYRDDERLPSQRKTTRSYRTRPDPFADVWAEVEQQLRGEPRLRAKTLFDDLQRQHPGEFDDSTRRTFERRVANWRAIHGPDKTVIFPQDHHPGRFAASDFTVCNSLGVKIAGAVFKHTLFHCVLTYSNVESVSLCFSESFEALSEGIQNAFWQFGGVPIQHRTDSLSAAVRNHSDSTTLTTRYSALMQHYGCAAQKTNARCANENGDVESLNGHLKDRIDQAL
ncbi:IS21 family transposase, partial [Rhodopirellula bahusiensis]|uniref:IS21 family transposase n=1 Tax=Rhodopirellula bahusiensis TaxID=2014065 RepID=UPI003299A678